MASKKKTSVTKEEVLRCIPGSKGLIHYIEEELNCTRDAVKNAIELYPEIKKEMEDEAEREKDMVMANLIEDAKAGDKHARELYLKSQARDRGFGDKVELTGAEGQPLVFLHAVATDLTANSRNGNAGKSDRISSWQGKAIEYHETQLAETQSKSVDELLAVKSPKGKKK